MAATFGIDFGTTNSLISVVSVDEGRAQIRRFLQQGTRPHPSVVWYPGEHPVAGQRAKDQLSELGRGVFGDIVRSPKMFLGQATGINIGGIIRSPIEVVADLLTFLRQDALNR